MVLREKKVNEREKKRMRGKELREREREREGIDYKFIKVFIDGSY